MKKNKFDGYKNLALITQIGLSVLIPIMLCLALGIYIDKKVGTNMMWTIIFLIIGVLSGFLNIFKFGGSNKTKIDNDYNIGKNNDEIDDVNKKDKHI